MSILKKLTIENFKGIGQEVSIEFKPITLFFGQNSAGKSTVLHALNYLHDILNLHEINADSLSQGHGSIDLGGFKHFVHKHDLNKDIKLSLLLDLNSIDLTETKAGNLYNDLLDLFLTEFHEQKLIDISSFTHLIKTSKINLTISWSELLNKPYVKSLSIDINDLPIVTIESSSNCRRVEIVKFDYWHPIFTSDEDYSDITAITEDIIQERYLNANGNALIALSGTKDALPCVDYNLRLDDIWNDDVFLESRREKSIFKALLSLILLGPLEIAADEVEKFRYLGPIRKIPNRDYSPRKSIQTNWSDGLAAWDSLFHVGKALVDEAAHEKR